MSVTTAVLVNRYVELDRLSKEKGKEKEAIDGEKDSVEIELMQRFQNAGIKSMKTENNENVYIRRDLFTGAVEGGKEQLYRAIKEIPELSHMVTDTVNHNTLSAWGRERVQDHFGKDADKKAPEQLVDAFPSTVKPFIKMSEKFSLRVTKG